MTHWLRSLVTGLSLLAFLLQNVSALSACPHHGGADDVCAAEDADYDGGDSDSDHHPAHAPHAPCQGCVHCTIAKMPCSVPVSISPLACPCRGDTPASALLDYTPPTAGRLIRPPR